MAVVTPTDRLQSVRNRYVIDVFGGVFVFSRCFLDFFSVGVGADFYLFLVCFIKLYTVKFYSKEKKIKQIVHNICIV